MKKGLLSFHAKNGYVNALPRYIICAVLALLQCNKPESGENSIDYDSSRNM